MRLILFANKIFLLYFLRLIQAFFSHTNIPSKTTAIRIGISSTFFLKTVVIISGVLVTASAGGFQATKMTNAASMPSASAPAKTETGAEVKQSDWFSQASQCPDVDNEAAIGVQDNTVTLAFDEGLNCLGEAFLNN